MALISETMTNEMRFASVALTYANNGSGIESCGASAILIDDDFAISHGSLLNPRITSDPSIRQFLVNMTPGELTSVPAKIRDDSRILVYQQRSTNYTDFNGNDDDGSLATMKASRGSDHVPEIEENEGSIVIAWKCPLLENTFRELLYSWSFDKTRAYDSCLLSIFLMVRLRRKSLAEYSPINEEVSRARLALERFIENTHHPLRNPVRGTSVELSSTPFGNPVFYDSISRGVVSNVFGDDGSVMLTDANTVPGSEGAPVYVMRSDGTRSYICGMVIAPLSWCRGEWVDYTFAASLLPCLRSLLRSRSLEQRIVDESNTRIVDSLDRSLVLVRCGDGWGTGIIFDAETGTIITCSHVVQKAPESRIKVVLRRGDGARSSGSSSPSTTSWAKLVYRTAKGEPYDVAVLRLDPREIEPTLRSIKIASRPSIRPGEAVASAGFPFFSSRLPTITRGNVSGITECMLRTTCCVQSGSSGGPIVRWSNGEMLGMVVCNAIATNRTRLYPRLNMAVPVAILEPPISEYLRTGHVAALDALGRTDPSVKRTWNFHRLPSSKI